MDEIFDLLESFWVQDFSICFAQSNIQHANLSYFKLNNVITMQQMFQGCSSLLDMILSNRTIPKVINMSYICYLSTVRIADFSNLRLPELTNLISAFSGCTSLESVNLSNLHAPNLTTLSNLFSGCTSLESVNLSNVYVPKLTTLLNAFKNCTLLETIDLSTFYCPNLTSMESMFEGCIQLKSVNFTNFITKNVTNMFSVFYNCSSLANIDLSSFDTSNVTTMYGMFTGTSIIRLDLSSFSSANLINMEAMFAKCTNLVELVLNKEFGNNVVSVTNSEIDMYATLDNGDELIFTRLLYIPTLDTNINLQTIYCNENVIKIFDKSMQYHSSKSYIADETVDGLTKYVLQS